MWLFWLRTGRLLGSPVFRTSLLFRNEFYFVILEIEKGVIRNTEKRMDKQRIQERLRDIGDDSEDYAAHECADDLDIGMPEVIDGSYGCLNENSD
jgi:hypothetical protein